MSGYLRGGVAMPSREDGLEQDVIDETAQTLVPTLLGTSEAKRQSVMGVLDGLEVDLDVVVDALLPLLDETLPTKLASRVSILTRWPHTWKTWKSQGIPHWSGKSPGNCGLLVMCYRSCDSHKINIT